MQKKIPLIILDIRHRAILVPEKVLRAEGRPGTIRIPLRPARQ
jgi:hypothetical protein